MCTENEEKYYWDAVHSEQLDEDGNPIVPFDGPDIIRIAVREAVKEVGLDVSDKKIFKIVMERLYFYFRLRYRLKESKPFVQLIVRKASKVGEKGFDLNTSLKHAIYSNKKLIENEVKEILDNANDDEFLKHFNKCSSDESENSSEEGTDNSEYTEASIHDEENERNENGDSEETDDNDSMETDDNENEVEELNWTCKRNPYNKVYV